MSLLATNTEIAVDVDAVEDEQAVDASGVGAQQRWCVRSTADHNSGVRRRALVADVAAQVVAFVVMASERVRTAK